MTPKGGLVLVGFTAAFGLVAGISNALHPDSPVAKTQAHDSAEADSSVANSDKKASASDTKWARHYAGYYVTCMVTGGIRWFTAINESDVNDARVNQTPSDAEWQIMCGDR